MSTYDIHKWTVKASPTCCLPTLHPHPPGGSRLAAVYFFSIHCRKTKKKETNSFALADTPCVLGVLNYCHYYSVIRVLAILVSLRLWYVLKWCVSNSFIVLPSVFYSFSVLLVQHASCWHLAHVLPDTANRRRHCGALSISPASLSHSCGRPTDLQTWPPFLPESACWCLLTETSGKSSSNLVSSLVAGWWTGNTTFCLSLSAAHTSTNRRKDWQRTCILASQWHSTFKAPPPPVLVQGVWIFLRESSHSWCSSTGPDLSSAG